MIFGMPEEPFHAHTLHIDWLDGEKGTYEDVTVVGIDRHTITLTGRTFGALTVPMTHVRAVRIVGYQ